MVPFKVADSPRVSDLCFSATSQNLLTQAKVCVDYCGLLTGA